MSNSETSEQFTFWLHFIDRYIWTYSSIDKLVKCVINRESITTEGAFQVSKAPLNIRIDNIFHVDFSAADELFSNVVIMTRDGDKYRLSPANPFIPGSYNGREARALFQIIEAFSSGSPTPALDSNPYQRQLCDDDVPLYVKSVSPEAWDQNISPIAYLEKYNPKEAKTEKVIDGLRPKLQILALIVSVIISVWIIGYLISN